MADRYVLIGGGVSCATAAEVLRAERPEAEITVLTEEEYPFYYRPMLPFLLSGSLEKERLLSKRLGSFQAEQVSYRTSSKAVEIDLARHVVKLATGEELPYDKLLLGTGSKPKPLSAPGAYGANLSYLNELADAVELHQRLEQESKAVVAGNDLSAVWVLVGLVRAGLQVHLLTAGEHLGMNALDERAAKLVEGALRKAGVTISHQGVKRVLDSEQGLAGILTEQGDRLEAQLLFPAEGYTPNVALARNAGLEVAEGILVNEHFQTSDPDVYAAGDVVELADAPPLARVGKGWLQAYREGRLAAHNMLGDKVGYSGKVRRYSVRVFDLDVAVLGDATGTGPGYEERWELFEEVGIYKRLTLKDGVLVGALLVGNIAEASRLERYIREQRTLRQLSGKFLRQLFDSSYLVSESYGVICPVCKYQMTLDQAPKEGDRLSCPVCGAEFRLERLAGRLVARPL